MVPFVHNKMPSTTSKHLFGPKEVELHNGTRMPILGLGTSHSGGYSQEAVVYALKNCGYRLIDTAKRYGCEEYIQAAIKLSGVQRDDLFLTTKLWPKDYGFSSARKACQGSLNRLGVDYIDLYMMHFPLCPSVCVDKAKTLEETWRALEVMYDEGLCRAIGVSNYSVEDLEKLLTTASIVPHVNQVEFHPYQRPVSLLKYCRDQKIQVEIQESKYGIGIGMYLVAQYQTGFCPLGKGRLLNEEPVLKVAENCKQTSAQVLIRWSIQNGVVTIPMSTKVERVKENAEVFDFEISKRDMDLLNNLHDDRRFVDLSTVQERIDSNLPDGYRLPLHSNGPKVVVPYTNHT